MAITYLEAIGLIALAVLYVCLLLPAGVAQW